MSGDTPFHIRILETALEDARERVQTATGDLVDFDTNHAEVLDHRNQIVETLRQAEVDRMGAEDAIRHLGYEVPPRTVKGAPHV